MVRANHRQSKERDGWLKTDWSDIESTWARKHWRLSVTVSWPPEETMRNGWGPSTWSVLGRGGQMVWPMTPLFCYYCTQVWDSRYSQSHYQQRRDLPQAPWYLAEDQLLTNDDWFSSAAGSRCLIIGTESASSWFLKSLVSAPASSTLSLLLRRLELGWFSANSKNLKMFCYW